MKVDINSLHNWDRNPRDIKEADMQRLVTQMKELGQYKPLLVTNEGTVLGGNMRLRALRQLGAEMVEVNVVEFLENDKGWSAKVNGVIQSKVFTTKEQGMTEYALSDNDEAGHYVKSELTALLSEVGGIDMELYHVSLGTSLSLSDFMGRSQPVTADDEAPALDEENPPVSQPGQMFQLGPHRLLCGDATSRSDYDRLLAGVEVGMVFTDPPYNIGYSGGGGVKRQGIMNDKMGAGEFYDFLFKIMENLNRVSKGGIYVCMSPQELGALKYAFESAGGHWQGYIIWVKNSATLGGSDYQHMYEPILYGWPEHIKEHQFVPFRDLTDVWEDLREVSSKFDGEYTSIRFQGFEVRVKGKVEGEVRRKPMAIDIWRYDRPTKSAEHPTMKPLALCTEAIKNSSKVGQVVLDTFLGSGSTLIAADKIGRVCYGMELDPKYCDVIRKRYAISQGAGENWQEITPVVGTVV